MRVILVSENKTKTIKTEKFFFAYTCVCMGESYRGVDVP